MKVHNLRLWGVLLVMVALLGGQFSPATGTNHAMEASAAAPDAPQNGAVYLPVLVRNTPTLTTFGVEMTAVTPSGGLTRMVQAGSSWMRLNGLVWSQVEPAPNQIDWSAASALETNLITAAQNNLRVILIVRSTPAWAQRYPQAGPTCGPIDSAQFGAFGAFMQQAVARYSQPPFNVKYWEIYNEPDAPLLPEDNLYGCWGDANEAYFGGQYYGEMLKAVVPYIKAADPYAQVMNGGLLMDCDPRTVCPGSPAAKYLEGIVASGAVSALDGLAFHAYDYTGIRPGVYGNGGWDSTYVQGPVLAAKVDYIRSLVDLTGKFLVNTEVAILKNNGTCDTTCEQNKAIYVGQAYTLGIVKGLRANIWYSAISSWNSSGLLISSQKPLPAYFAYLFARRELINASYLASIDSFPNVKVYELDRGDRRIWVLWSTNEQEVPISLAEVPLAVWKWNAAANQYQAQAPSTDLTVSLAPVYLEWNR